MDTGFRRHDGIVESVTTPVTPAADIQCGIIPAEAGQ